MNTTVLTLEDRYLIGNAIEVYQFDNETSVIEFVFPDFIVGVPTSQCDKTAHILLPDGSEFVRALENDMLIIKRDMTVDVGKVQFSIKFTMSGATIPVWSTNNYSGIRVRSRIDADNSEVERIDPSIIEQLTAKNAEQDIRINSLEIGGVHPTEEIDPTVPLWAKEENKPAYTAFEVGALPFDTIIPSKTSDLTNNSGYVDGSDVDVKMLTHNTNAASHPFILDEIDKKQPLGSYITEETDPTVSAWAKQPTKPSYTAGEVGAETAGAVNTHNSSGTAHSDIRSTLASKADLVDGVIPANQLPSYVDDVLEYADLASLPATGTTGKIYIALDTNLTYRWSGSAYVEISKSLALGETSATAYRGDRGKTAYDHSQVAHAPVDAEKNVQSDWSVSDTGSDAFIANKPTALTPTAHKTTHATGGSDALTANDIGAEPSGAVSSHNSSGTAHADIRSALGAKVDSASLATVATSGSYDDLANKPTVFLGWTGTQAAYDAIPNKVTTPLTLYVIVG